MDKGIKRKAQELTNSLAGKDKVRVLSVRLGNICRTPADGGVLKRLTL